MLNKNNNSSAKTTNEEESGKAFSFKINIAHCDPMMKILNMRNGNSFTPKKTKAEKEKQRVKEMPYCNDYLVTQSTFNFTCFWLFTSRARDNFEWFSFPDALFMGNLNFTSNERLNFNWSQVAMVSPLCLLSVNRIAVACPISEKSKNNCALTSSWLHCHFRTFRRVFSANCQFKRTVGKFECDNYASTREQHQQFRCNQRPTQQWKEVSSRSFLRFDVHKTANVSLYH